MGNSEEERKEEEEEEHEEQEEEEEQEQEPGRWVQKAEVDMGGKATVKGVFDPEKIRKRLEKKSRRKVELVSPLPKKDNQKKEDVKKKKEPEVKKTVLKVHIHCSGCEEELKKKLKVMDDGQEGQTCSVEGTVEPEKLVKFLRKTLKKPAEVVPPKEDKKKEDKKEDKKEEKAASAHYVNCISHGSPYCSIGNDIFSDENPNACCVM
ncbi:unnamed protein product [Spirodela intermedia]|uniref:Uncharacterized protein n=1 Tax=Spirodela intermedia TaxID=51605 RepID=A0A7I8IH66_SPIIN|nr:unnamed protein product [Spirodela intermedia]CAA6657221.1 unnamed protein product [Spirodela intermedia]